MPPAILLAAFLLGLLFLGAGGLKLMAPHGPSRQRFGWLSHLDGSSYRAAGWFELAGGVGLMFPTMVQAVDWLTPLAASGLGVEMAVATLVHGRRKEWRISAVTVALAAGLLLVAVNAIE